MLDLILLIAHTSGEVHYIQRLNNPFSVPGHCKTAFCDIFYIIAIYTRYQIQACLLGNLQHKPRWIRALRIKKVWTYLQQLFLYWI